MPNGAPHTLYMLFNLYKTLPYKLEAIIIPSVGNPTFREVKEPAKEFQSTAGPGFAPSLSDSRACALNSSAPLMPRHKAILNLTNLKIAACCFQAQLRQWVDTTGKPFNM